MARTGRYAKPELERRFLLAGVPDAVAQAPGTRIHDRYIVGTRLRLRRVEPIAGEAVEYKLGHKEPLDPAFPSRVMHTTIYLTAAEYGVLVPLPAHLLEKTRYPIEHGGDFGLGVDVFDGKLAGLVLAEVQAATIEQLDAVPLPAFALAEVSNDIRFTGGMLAAATPADAAALLAR